jgi:hypothetical protein
VICIGLSASAIKRDRIFFFHVFVQCGTVPKTFLTSYLALFYNDSIQKYCRQKSSYRTKRVHIPEEDEEA